MRINVLTSILLSFSLICTQGCKENKEEIKPDLPNISVIDISLESNWDYWVIANNGDYFFISEKNSLPEFILVYSSEADKYFSIFVDDNGFPDKVIVDDYIFVFANFKDFKVDVAAIDPNGKTEIVRDIETEFNWDDFNLKSSKTVHAWSDVIRWSGRLVGAIPCVISVAATLSLPVITWPIAAIAAWTCGNYISGLAVAIADDYEVHNGVTDFVGTYNTAMLFANCGIGKYLSCATGAIQRATEVWADEQQTIENRYETIENAEEQLVVSNYETGTVTDIDSNVYQTVKIGNQWWMAQNMATTKYNDGTTIPLVTDSLAWIDLIAPAYCWYNNNEATYKNPYGSLYNWYVVNTGKLCPIGWHVPDNSDWTILADYLGGLSVAGTKLKESGTDHWLWPNTGATNESGFTALPGGCRYEGEFSGLGYTGTFWSFTEGDPNYSWFWGLTYSDSFLGRSKDVKVTGYNVRCVKD